MKPALVFPYLPQKRITKAIISGGASEDILNSLIKYGIDPVKTLKHPMLPSPLSRHVDMQLVTVCEGVFVYAPDTAGDTISTLENLGYELIRGTSHLDNYYPRDVAYNCAIVGKNCFLNPKHTDSTVLAMLDKCDIRIHPVKQGYAKCSTCILTKEAIITADTQIHGKAIEAGLDSLLIPPQKDIVLKGYDYGFIGGASGLLSDNELAFFGDFETLMEAGSMLKFLSKHGIKPISLTYEKVVDLGGFFPLCASYNGQ